MDPAVTFRKGGFLPVNFKRCSVNSEQQSHLISWRRMLEPLGTN
jgi:hypothetical protein